ncbi:hypothetical protein [Nocardia wallacei]|nr:hypothetical protein [Nocardia wallacei]
MAVRHWMRASASVVLWARVWVARKLSSVVVWMARWTGVWVVR